MGGGETHDEKSGMIIAAKQHQAVARQEIDNDTER